jgi:hypothetical protein
MVQKDVLANERLEKEKQLCPDQWDAEKERRAHIVTIFIGGVAKITALKGSTHSRSPLPH